MANGYVKQVNFDILFSREVVILQTAIVNSMKLRIAYMQW